MKCPRCGKESKLIEAPDNELWDKVCTDCNRYLWQLHDREVGLEAPAGISRKNKIKYKRQYEPTARHKDIADVAYKLGTQVTGEDVKRIFEAARLEHDIRTGGQNYARD